MIEHAAGDDRLRNQAKPMPEKMLPGRAQDDPGPHPGVSRRYAMCTYPRRRRSNGMRGRRFTSKKAFTSLCRCTGALCSNRCAEHQSTRFQNLSGGLTTGLRHWHIACGRAFSGIRAGLGLW